MELLVLDTSLQAVAVLDIFESLIWTDRYSSNGDFEIYTTASEEILNTLRQDYYLTLKESEHAMIIDDCQIKFDVENGNHMIFTGESLESLLKRRIVWKTTVLSGNLQNGIELLLNENAISPTDPDRVIPNLVFESSTDPAITSLTVDAQFTRTELYSTIKKLCDSNDIGFKITLSDNNEFVFKLYSGVDRSYDQITNPYVVFSPKFENILSSNYLTSKRNVKTITVVAGEGEGDARKTTVVGGGSGLARREMYTDARDISQTVDDVTMSDSEYAELLSQRGIQDLSDRQFIDEFEGEADVFTTFKYGVDFFMGDEVQLVSEYGLESKSRIKEVVFSQDSNGVLVLPIFSSGEKVTINPNNSITPGGSTSPYARPIDADLLSGKSVKILSNAVNFGTTASNITGFWKIRIETSVLWMLYFKIMLYQYYNPLEFNVSGYKYGANHWYASKAEKVSGTITTTVYFGYDSDGIEWVAFPSDRYTGISISNITNGYNQIPESWDDVFKISHELTLSGTIQNTVNL